MCIRDSINANRALYNVSRELYEDIQAAQILGMSSDKIRSDMQRRGEVNAFRSLTEAEFRPLTISDDLRKILEQEQLNWVWLILLKQQEM